ncbi:hypothetical protein C1646_768465 [Rhizophagus diaphanus]|nr:hypothetical protein C1646_768465 [Rhizophagus diaphanus] [Rhizophagus sp. MUCL 43196]
MRGYSLKKDLRLLINNPKYSDIEILYEVRKKLYGCKAILAVRSEVFNGLLYNGMKESYANKITFPNINSFGIEIIMEYIYMGSIKEEFLTNQLSFYTEGEEYDVNLVIDNIEGLREVPVSSTPEVIYVKLYTSK